MIQFIYYTDPHGKGVSPSTRTDDFMSTLETKLLDMFQYGEEQGVDAYLCGGDFVDSPYVTPRFVKRYGHILKKANRPTYHVWGNHDMIAWNPSTIQDTSLGLFAEFEEDFHLLTQKPTYVVFNGQEVALTGVSSYARLDRTIEDDEGVLHRSRDYIVKKQKAVPHIHIVHGYLSPRAILEDIPHTIVNEIIETEAELTLTGHEHTGFPLVTFPNGNQVINPGALSRVFASHTEMNRMPQFLHIIIDDDGKVQVTPVQSRVALKGENVMDRTKLDEKKLHEEILKNAKGSLKEILSQINIERVDLRTIITRFKDEIEPDIYQEVKRRLNL